MSGSKSFVPGSSTVPEPPDRSACETAQSGRLELAPAQHNCVGASVRREPLAPLSFTVHSVPSSAELVSGAGSDAQRTARGRLKMLLVLLVCAAPVVASYFTYFVIRPEGRTNYSELIQPPRLIPADLPLTDLQGKRVDAASLKGQWLLVVVAGGACDVACDAHLWLQRQLRETLGRDKDRLDKVWLINDAAMPRPETLRAIDVAGSVTVLRVPPDALATWMRPAPGQTLEDHMAIIDPFGHWMMRVPSKPEPARLKRDIEKLLRASAGWDRPGR
jgi:hypothetical protein